MGTFADALQDAVDTLNTAGAAATDPWAATLDPRELQLPGVWVKLVGLTGRTQGEPAGGLVVATFYCCVPTVDLIDSYAQLAQLLPQVAAVVPPMSEPQHVALALPGGGTPATAMAYDHTLVIT